MKVMDSKTEQYTALGNRRKVLIVDDELINRELLGNALTDDYDIIYAADGEEALQKIYEYRSTLSLVLLDILMPELSGIEVLKKKKQDPVIASIPVIVLTADQQSEVECLNLGAVDFIPKPYPQITIMKARINRTIELNEDRAIINTTERDPLTGLYNKNFFYSYCNQFDQYNINLPMDAMLADIHHFHVINERYGIAFGDKVLRLVADRLRDYVTPRNGIVCRNESDTFLIYCPHGMDYNEILDYVTSGLEEENPTNSQIRIRLGVYPNVDKLMVMERRFDRAKAAADTLRNSLSNAVAIYDDSLYQKDLFNEQLIAEFGKALEEGQFEVYYQPKYDITKEEPILSSAEALIRWKHPSYGLISPASFIPLFETNGLIYELDNFVWKSAARQIAEWKKRFGISVPVSVNVSRVDMHDPNLERVLCSIVENNHISTKELLLEITESAYTRNSAQIIDTVKTLREKGFKVEMDDFGTGYSSLNMISKLPIDVLKVAKEFIDDAFESGRDTGMLEIMLDIADYLKVPVIAEGVETREQMLTLKELGCDVIQGYYFSKPVPALEFEKFISEKKSELDA